MLDARIGSMALPWLQDQTQHKGIMKTQQLILSVALVITATACDKKSDVSGNATAGKADVQNVQQPASQAAKDLPKNIQELSQPVNNEVSQHLKKMKGDGASDAHKTDAKEETTEQVLDAVRPNRQEPANSRIAEQKQRGKNAEDEMMMEIGNRK